ncbi:hypothetical protein RvY_03558 [Ramazzottius varieornatus]|uniref:Uncharacterized protein n=1 Tax=Ramazzottius varieornatus TaxID=947166 RepID=A0A1D1UYM9_RAMVA|nr:hypothetical protein RvY_03558 [Ramazzottius varieornatus]
MMMKSVLFALCALVVGSSCQSSPAPQFYPAGRQSDTSNASRVSQLDQDVRGAFNNRFNGQEPSGTAVVPAIPIQPGATIITPPQTRTIQVQHPATVTQVQPQQNGGLDLGAILSAKGFMQNIFSPQLLTPAEASAKLTPKLITPQIQQSIGMPVQQPGQLANGLDARQINSGLGGFPQQGMLPQQGMFPQQNAFGQQPLYGGQQGLFGQQPLLGGGFPLQSNSGLGGLSNLGYGQGLNPGFGTTGLGGNQFGTLG